MKKIVVLLLAICLIFCPQSANAIKYTSTEAKTQSEVKIKAKDVKKEIEVTEMTEELIAEEQFCDSLELLAICVEAEAGNQDMMGKRLVVDVILNRVDSDRFPNDIEAVITEPHQFASWTDGGMDAVFEPSEETFEAVRMELEQRTDSDILFFTAGGYNKYCNPAYKYGDHYFGY